VNASEYRQQVAEFRDRLTDFAHGNVPKGKRIHINPTGSRTRFTPSRSDIERMSTYGERRYYSIARVMALFEILRNYENLAARNSPVRVKATGAYWQAYRFASDRPACHTCPALLMLDGAYPIMMTTNMGLRRHIIATFADCMVMPVSINRIDRFFDDKFGWPAFVAAASDVLNDGSSWYDGVNRYTSEMRILFGDMISILNGDHHFDDAETQQRIDVTQAFYEGLFLTAMNHAEMNNFMNTVHAEMAIS